MGMEFTGNKPTSEAGEYFRISARDWQPIDELTYQLCREQLGDSFLALML